jgi:aminoglycoside 3-N-acetyltransferase
MCKVKYNDIISKLRDVGLSKGDIVLVHSSLSKIGVVDGIAPEDRKAFLECIYRAFNEVLDIPNGSLVVPTFTHEYARNKVPFIYEESPSEVGVFSEYVRKLPESFRSLHPINSFAAIGRHKYEICKNLSISCYGFNSVFDRLINNNAKMMFLGAGMYHMTLKHHMEHICGLPYAYHKAYFTPVIKDGKEQKLPFLSCVRYLNGKVNNNKCVEFREYLENKKLINQIRIGNAEVLCMPIKDVYYEAYNLLQNDPCYFLEDPYYTVK